MPQRNPSVVEGDVSNYNISRTDMGFDPDPFNFMQQQRYMEQLQRMQEMHPVSPETRPEDHYPAMGRGIQVGTTQTQTLGAQPIFAAGTGMIPMGVLQNWRRARYEQQMQALQPREYDEEAMLDPEIKELENPVHDAAFNERIKSEIDEMIAAYAAELDGDYIQAQKALKQDGEFQNRIRQYNHFARAYNKAHGVAMSIVERAGDPEYYVSDEEKEWAKDLVQARMDIEDLTMEELVQKANESEKMRSLVSMADLITDNVGTHVKEYIVEMHGHHTNKRNLYEKVRKKGFSDEFIDTLIDDFSEMFNRELDKDERESLTRIVKSKLDDVTERQINDIVKEQQQLVSQFQDEGVLIGADGEVQYVNHNSEFVTGGWGRGATEHAVGIEDVDFLMDEGTEIEVRKKDGTIVEGTLIDPLPFKPNVTYNSIDREITGETTADRWFEGRGNFHQLYGRIYSQEQIEDIKEGEDVDRKEGGVIRFRLPDGSVERFAEDLKVRVRHDEVEPQLASTIPGIYQLGNQLKREIQTQVDFPIRDIKQKERRGEQSVQESIEQQYQQQTEQQQQVEPEEEIREEPEGTREDPKPADQLESLDQAEKGVWYYDEVFGLLMINEENYIIDAGGEIRGQVE